MSKMSKLITNPKLFFSDMAKKRQSSTPSGISPNVNKSSSAPKELVASKAKPKVSAANNKKTVVSVPDLISRIFNLSQPALIETDLPVFLYFPWIQEHGNELIRKVNASSGADFKILPLDIAKDISSKANRSAINKFAREYPDVYKKIIARSLIGYRNLIKGFIFTLDWNPSMRLIVDVCRDFDIPTILILDLTLYIQTHFLSYGCDNFLRINSRGERYPSALCG